ncbi:MAG TPA: DUF72 domain-containing protein [Candidatus Bathyarchaeota archaeon]|nr:DUF72 domain-containing protein [Candidatus Bathyarchaeota archaeon]HEX68882.1 DUF72 domain-containing protein [Candidatus Bathyarchaeota archaeon]
MKKYLIGAGGWAYFRVPGVHPLRAYSMAFDFVEVNSTYYRIPDLELVRSWRRIVPEEFEFSVRCHRSVPSKLRTGPNELVFRRFEKIIEICRILGTDLLHVLFQRDNKPTRELADTLRNFLSSVDAKGIRLILEFRGQAAKFDREFLKLMEDWNMVHCVDLSKGETPAFQTDVLYSRLFGKGEHNIYQPTDEELKEIDKLASEGDHDKVMLCFHFVKMYKDAIRFKIYKQTGSFPMVTSSTGLDSLAEILKEDARFPASKGQLQSSQGWKLIDLTRDKRIRASELLRLLPEKRYGCVEEVINELQKRLKGKNSVLF